MNPNNVMRSICENVTNKNIELITKIPNVLIKTDSTFLYALTILLIQKMEDKYNISIDLYNKDARKIEIGFSKIKKATLNELKKEISIKLNSSNDEFKMIKNCLSKLEYDYDVDFKNSAFKIFIKKI